MQDRGNGNVHNGIDIYAPSDSSVKSITNGRVLYIGDGRKEWSDTKDKSKASHLARAGLWIDIIHGGNTYRYLHLGSSSVEIGKDVESGQTIGTVASAGESGLGKGKDNTHIHFEVRKGESTDYGKALTPEDYLYKDVSYDSMVALPNTENEYRKLEIGQLVYDRDGNIGKISKISSYPYFEVMEQDSRIGDTVTADENEAANWILDSATKDTEYSFARDGILKFSSWGDRILPYREKIGEARKIQNPSDRLREAISIKADIKKIGNEGRAESFINAQKVKAGIVSNKAASAAKVMALSVWDEIPTGAKWAIGGTLAVGGVLLVKKVVD